MTSEPQAPTLTTHGPLRDSSTNPHTYSEIPGPQPEINKTQSHITDPSLDLTAIMNAALETAGCPIDNPELILAWATQAENQRAMAAMSFFFAMVTQMNIYKYRNQAIRKLAEFAEMKSDNVSVDQARKACNDLARIDVVKINHINTILKNTLNPHHTPSNPQSEIHNPQSPPPPPTNPKPEIHNPQSPPPPPTNPQSEIHNPQSPPPPPACPQINYSSNRKDRRRQKALANKWLKQMQKNEYNNTSPPLRNSLAQYQPPPQYPYITQQTLPELT